MPILTLQHPVYSLENQTLLPADTIINEETLDALITSGKAETYKSYSLLKHGTVLKDLNKFLTSPPYNAIFNDHKQTADILTIMGSVDYVSPLFQSIDYFKINDFYTYRHILVVFALATLLTEDLVPDHYEKLKGTMAGPFHDIGKICVPLRVLKKSDPLTQAELSSLKHHTLAGYILLCYYLQKPRDISAIVARDHHERRDGSGYPRGIREGHLLREIVAATDIYDALISPRPYRRGVYDNRTALEELTEMAENNKIAPDVVKALIAHNRKRKPDYKDCIVSYDKRGIPPPDNAYGVIADKEE